jgi:L-cysteine S-thiosulfotransferase
MRSAFVAIVVFLAVAPAGCENPRKSAAGFHLPDGDVQRGRAAFVDLRCHACHEVRGETLPLPVADPPVPVKLGGIVYQARTDGELAAAIVDPSHRLSGHPRRLVRAGSLSRMGDANEAMTVQQLVDLVAFLQSTYEERPPLPYGGM